MCSVCVRFYRNLASMFTVQFENSLGRLTAASVHNPRHIIDVAVERPCDDTDEKAKQFRRYKELLLHIENVSLFFVFRGVQGIETSFLVV